MGLQTLDLGVLGRPTAVGVAAQDVTERRRTAGQGLAVGQRPAMQPEGPRMPIENARKMIAAAVRGVKSRTN